MKASIRSIALLAVALIAALSGLCRAASAETYSCHIGKPSYCSKFGGNLCEKWNSAPGAPAACEQWTAACYDCHAQIPDCLEHHRPAYSSPLCSQCLAAWRSCMNRIDALYWPNRMAGPPGDNHDR